MYDLVTTSAKTVLSEQSLQQTKATSNGDHTSSQTTDVKVVVNGMGKKRKRTASEGQSGVPSKRMCQGTMNYFVVVEIDKLHLSHNLVQGSQLYFMEGHRKFKNICLRAK